MSFPLWYIEKKLNAPLPQSIIHVGANAGQEFEAYQKVIPKTVVWIEPIPAIYQELCAKTSTDPAHYAIQACCSDISGDEVDFHIANHGGLSSSMLPLGEMIQTLHPGIHYVDSFRIKTRTLDSILDEKFPDFSFDLLVLDTQGSEFKVLQGAHKLLKTVRYVFTEVSEYPLYEGGCTHDQIYSFLKLYNFKIKYVSMNSKDWGNALYERA
jgi:FkbM family methyltransferase